MTPPRFTLKVGAILLVLGALLGAGVSSGMGRISVLSVSAAEGDPPTNPAEGRAGACLNQFSVFISSMLSFDDAKDYFQDLFERNQCQQDDIFGLDSQIESKMKDLRGMYFDRCASPEITELQTDIQELKMEQYFIRHIVPVAEDSTYKKDADALKEDFDAIKFALFLDMSKRYVEDKNWVTDEATLETMMQGWLDEYDDRIDEYVDCSSSPWQEVADKWKEFQEGVKELSEFAGAKPKSSQDREAEQQAEKEEREKEAGTSDSGEKNGGGTSVPGFLKKLFSLRINGVGPEQGLPQLNKTLKESGEALTLQGALDASDFELDRYSREVSKAELLAKYDLLYAKGSTDITNDLVTRITELRNIIEGTTKSALHALIESAKGIHSKQGKTSP